MEALGMIRPCRTEECGHLVGLLQEAELYADSVDTAESFLRKIQYDSESILVCEYDGHIVGMVIVVYDPWASFIWHLAVTPAYRGRGFGGQLLSAGEELIKRRGGSVTCGYILEGNHVSRSLFRKHGYNEYLMALSAVEKKL